MSLYFSCPRPDTKLKLKRYYELGLQKDYYLYTTAHPSLSSNRSHTFALSDYHHFKQSSDALFILLHSVVAAVALSLYLQFPVLLCSMFSVLGGFPSKGLGRGCGFLFFHRN